jgi:hypothetical protein
LSSFKKPWPVDDIKRIFGSEIGLSNFGHYGALKFVLITVQVNKLCNIEPLSLQDCVAYGFDACKNLNLKLWHYGTDEEFHVGDGFEF